MNDFRNGVFNLFYHYTPNMASLDLHIRSQTFAMFGGGVNGTFTHVIQPATFVSKNRTAAGGFVIFRVAFSVGVRVSSETLQRS